MPKQYNGYKLKPHTYQIQAGDIIIRIKHGIQNAPNGAIGIAKSNGCVNLPLEPNWDTSYSDWRAIETRPGSTAVPGDTVFCITHTGESCRDTDYFEVKKVSDRGVYPGEGTLLQSNEDPCEDCWNWRKEYFVVLIKYSEEVKPVDPSEAKPGDYVEWADSDYTPSMTHGNCYKVVKANPNTLMIIDNLNNHNIWLKKGFKNIAKDQKQQEEASTTSFIPFTIVDKQGDKRTCIGLSEDNWYISENTNGNIVHHNPLFWTKMETTNKPVDSLQSFIDKAIQEPVLISSDDHMDSLAYALRIPISYIAIDSMMNKPKQTKPNSKGKQMNSNLFTDILKLLMQTEQTDLEKAPSTYAFFYNNEGEYEGTARVANEAEAKALLQKPEHLGYTMRIYSFSDEFTTQIPVVSTIKKVTTSPTTKVPRKPRVAKA